MVCPKCNDFWVKKSETLDLKEVYAIAIFTARAQSHLVPPKRPSCVCPHPLFNYNCFKILKLI